jgi:hypothetical protein
VGSERVSSLYALNYELSTINSLLLLSHFLKLLTDYCSVEAIDGGVNTGRNFVSSNDPLRRCCGFISGNDGNPAKIARCWTLCHDRTGER